MNIKYNSGNVAILCNNCSKIVVEGKDIYENFGIDINDEYSHDDLVFCSDECRKAYYLSQF